MMQKQFDYKKFTILAKQILNKGQIPLYFCKFSNKLYTTYQHLVLLLMKTYEKKGYRAFISWLKASKVPEWLQLKKIPHFTTLQKFASRLKIPMLEKLLFESGTIKPFQRAGIDATGLTFRNPSRHYEKRVGLPIQKKDFFKTAIMADLDHQLVLAVKFRKKARHDTKDFIPLWNKIKNLPFRWFYMDRGYDANYCHQAIHNSGKISFGCLKNLDVPIHRTKGVARKKVKKHLKYKKKNWRVLIESINKAFKAIVGHVIESKNLHTQKVDVLLKLISYNLYRSITRNIIFALIEIALKIEQFFFYFTRKIQS